MDKKTKKITVITSCAMMLFGIIALPQVSSADDITVAGNGQNSSSSVTVTSSTQTTPQQTNTSQVTNNTNTSATTGNNTASGGTGGGTSVNTGNAAATSTVSNTGNVSTASTPGCGCNQDSTASITGNGEGSTNNVNVSNTTDTQVSVTQNADITNNVTQSADTGHNTANGNNGNVSIKTGDINGQITIKNEGINIANVSAPGGSNGSFNISISGNGENSVNTVTDTLNNITYIDINNSAAIINNLKAKYITGENSANSNNGNVSIETGNIIGSITVGNAANESTVAVTCSCEKEHNKQTPPPAPTPTPQPGNSSPSSSSSSSSTSSSGGGSSSGGSGSVMGASANNLPVTGGSYWFFIALIGNILMMLLGGYLRLRSGRSPGAAF